jgi:predicted amidohydrolase
MHRSISIATTQLEVTPAPLAERLGRAEMLVTQAAQAGAQLIALPEVFNTGYAYRDENFGLAEPPNGPTSMWMKQISAHLGVHLAGTLLLREGQEIYNALLLYAPDGRVWRYDKNYPWAWERAYFRGRRQITIAETDLGNIGLQICWDVAHASLWRQYAGKVDLMLACSCPPNIPDSTFHFPDGLQVTAAQMGPAFANLRQSSRQVFVDTPAQQTAWLGVPYVGSTACGRFRSHLPNPLGSFLGFLPTAPRLIRYLPRVKEIEVSASLVEAARIFAADGSQLAALHQEQGDAFALAEVSLPAERSQPRAPQPRPPVPRLAYLVSDHVLTRASRGVYARRNAKHDQ